MKQVFQNLRTGVLSVEDVPIPAVSPTGVLVRSAFSLISAGTERSKIQVARANLVEKARQRPDQVRQVLTNLTQEGVVATARKVLTRLNTPATLGYCSAGVVEDVGAEISEFKPGDRVACAGEGFACHAEWTSVPAAYCAKVPDGLPLDQAAFVALGAIALQAVRQAQVVLGERVAVIGLGLIGCLVVQLVKAAGARVVGVDIAPSRLAMAATLGADAVLRGDYAQVRRAVQDYTNGLGVDAVIIAAASTSNDPVILAGQIAREKGRVILLGAVPSELPRKEFYEKELLFSISRAFGAGSYDDSYLDGRTTYPIAYVPWTVQGNMQTFLDQVLAGNVKVNRLISKKFPIHEAEAAYRMVEEAPPNLWGLLFDYGCDRDLRAPHPAKRIWVPPIPATPASPRDGAVGVSVVGCGNFARSYLIPNLRSQKGVVLRWLSASTPTVVHHVAKRYGFHGVSCSSQDPMDDPGTDLVVIATRHGSHASLVEQALARNKAVFVEKPLAITHLQLAALCAAYRRAETHRGTAPFLMVGFNRRFSPYVTRLQGLFVQRHGPLVMHYRVNAGALPPDHWIYHPEDGGGRLIGEMCHFIDLFIMLTGSAPISVHAEQTGRPSTELIRADNVVLSLRFADGSIGNLVYTATGHPRFPRERLEVFGEGSVAVVDNFRSSMIVSGRRRRFWTFRQDIGHRQEMEALAATIREGKPSPIPFQETVLTTLTTLAALQSLQRGHPVPVDPDQLLNAGGGAQ